MHVKIQLFWVYNEICWINQPFPLICNEKLQEQEWDYYDFRQVTKAKFNKARNLFF